jgi:hypothetical protein
MTEHASDYSRGEMIIEEHKSTFGGFIKLTKWGSLYVAALLLLLTIWFCTSGGFLTALISAVVLVVAGTLALREKHKH